LIFGGESWYNSTMTIKRPMKTETPAAPVDDGATAAGGATIADRFKLDLQDPNAKKRSSSGTGTKIAVVAGLIALAVAGILTFVIYQHWEFLKGA